METRVSIKNIYLLLVISIGLIGLGVGSTFAMFVSTSNIDNPIAFSSNVNANDNTIETIEVTVPAYSDYIVDLVVSNATEESLHYSAWYKSSSNTLELAASSSNNDYSTSGIIPTSTNFTLTTTLRNRTSSSMIVTLGVSYDSEGVVLLNGCRQIPFDILDPLINENAATYITNLYLDNKDAVPVPNNGIDYQTASSKHLMNDRRDDSNGGNTASSLDGGNIRYYGASDDVNNYIYFNCDDYSNQTPSTCELWRIIGVFDGKVKIIRNDSIGDMSWDTSDSSVNTGYGENNWPDSDLMKLLNPGYESNSITVTVDDTSTDVIVNNSLYWNRTTGAVNYFSGQSNAYTPLASENNTFATSGLKNSSTKNKIAEVTWNLGGMNVATGLYPADVYIKERGQLKFDSTRATEWTGKVGLMYPSDYGYAMDFENCTVSYDNYTSTACKDNNWLQYSNIQWTIISRSSSAYHTFVINISGVVNMYTDCSVRAVRPTLFLNSDEYIWMGTGTSRNPYRIR